MVYHRWDPQCGRTTIVVELEGDEVNLSDTDLITMVDNRKKSCVDGVGQVCHFGGRVVRKVGKVNKSKTYAQVVVYID